MAPERGKVMHRPWAFVSVLSFSRHSQHTVSPWLLLLSFIILNIFSTLLPVCAPADEAEALH